MRELGMQILDSGDLNDVIAGYVRAALDYAKVDDKQKSRVMVGLDHALDRYCAEEAAEYYQYGAPYGKAWEEEEDGRTF